MHFSQQQAPAGENKKVDVPPTEDELKKNREEWGEKYQDENFRFEKEWKIISDDI